MSTAVLVAVAAALGNLLQGWDNATMAGAILYIKKEFKWENDPTMEGLTVATSLIGAALITVLSGRISDILGRRPMLIASSVLYLVSSILVVWSPNVHLLLLARLLDGFGIGLTITFVPLYISEMSPPEIRGLLSTVPQLTYTSGSFLSFCMVFAMSLVESPNWRVMLGVIFAPSFIFFALTVFYLPESPRWLVSKGRMLEARSVLERLRGRQDVSGEMALLVEGLETGKETTIEEYIIHPANEITGREEELADGEEIRIIGPDGLSSMVATPIPGQIVPNGGSHQGSAEKQSVFSVDPIVTLFGSIHEKLPDTGSKGSMYFPHFGSMFSVTGNQPRNEEWDEESLARDNDDYAESEENMHSPLISRQATSTENLRQESNLHSANEESGDSTAIGSGWQLAWNVNKEGSFKRVYLHEDGAAGSWRGSLISVQGGGDSADGEFIKAAALVSQPALCTKELLKKQHPVGPAMVHPSVAAAKGSSWKELFVPGVKNALLVGMGIEMLQQFVGINGILNYTPQILEQAGVGVVLSDTGLNSTSASVLISAVMTMLMLPCIVVAMRLMDISGRRSLLLSTGPVLTASLIFLAIGNGLHLGTTVKAAVSTISIVSYGCSFVMGFGPIPNILCSEIFPTRVRSTCIAICALSFWISNVIVTYSFPVMLSYIGVSGIFSIYAVWSVIALVFVYLKVPETKGMPLEVITEFFSVGAKQTAA